MSNNIEQNYLNGRLMSLDAIRGLDMFFLACMGGIFRALPALSDNNAFNWIARQCRHPEWAGFTAWDTIFPMFIFIVGVAMPFSFNKRLQKEGGKKDLFKHVLKRTLVLMILGVFLWQKPGGPHPVWGYYSVLYRIGFSYFFAALVLMNTNIKGQAYWAFGTLIFHWMLMRFFPVPGYGMGDFSQAGNFTTFLSDKTTSILSPDFRHVFSFSLIPSISNALFGVLAGQWLLSNRDPIKKTKGLLIAAIAFILGGLLVHLDFPINKEIGSPSFHLITCGISTLLLGVFFWLIDVKGYRKWAFFLVVVGVNPITIYVAGFLIGFHGLANVLVGAFNFGNAQTLMLAIVAAVIKWSFLYYLYKQKVFFKI